MGMFEFWWKCIRWAFGRWESAHRILTTFIIFLGLLGVGGVAFATWGNQVMALIAVVPIIVMLIFVAPYKLWKEKADMVAKLTTKRLEVDIEERPEETDTTSWWHLIVRNPSSSPIKSCYGQLISFEPNKHNKPYRGLRLPWSSWVTRERERYTIPGNASSTLDFVAALPRYFSIVALSTEEGKATFFNLEGPGTYKVELQVGSEEEDFLATKIKARIVYAGDRKLTIEKIGDNGRN